MRELILEGCRPVPLAHYLKALGVLRLVAEQKCPEARGCWRQDRFELHTSLDREALERFFLEDYIPTPIVGPWGARSGFFPSSSEKSAREALTAIRKSSEARFAPFRRAIEAVEALLGEMGIRKKAEVESRKFELLQTCRARLPDDVVPWLDACYVLTGDDRKFPPLLGTGGNEGSGSYMSGFAQQVVSCLIHREHDAALGAALWNVQTNGVVSSQTPGHFLPEAAGGKKNSGQEFDADSSMNPWDYVLCLEGSVVFAAALVRRNGETAPGQLAFPFTVRPIAAGFGSAADEHARAEIWMPIWDKPARFCEISHLIAEGRSQVARRPAINGIDFARAVAMLGIDRGITAFQRYCFMERNGLNFIATPLTRIQTCHHPRVRLLDKIDGWLDRFRSRATSDRAPASVARVQRNLDNAILELCKRGDALRLQDVFIGLGRCELALATSLRWTLDEARLRPVPPLSPEWLSQIDDDSPELRLAASLASVTGRYGRSTNARGRIPLRSQVEPIATWVADGRLHVRWSEEGTGEIVWMRDSLVASMNAALARRLHRATQSGSTTYPDRGRLRTEPGDVVDFIECRVNDRRLEDLFLGCLLLDWSRVSDQPLATRTGRRSPAPSALYPLLKLCYPGWPVRGEQIPVEARIHRAAMYGDGDEAAQLAVRRLRGCGLQPAISSLSLRGEAAQRTAAAVLFPLNPYDVDWFAQRLCRPEENPMHIFESVKPKEGEAS